MVVLLVISRCNYSCPEKPDLSTVTSQTANENGFVTGDSGSTHLLIDESLSDKYKVLRLQRLYTTMFRLGISLLQVTSEI